MKMLTHVEVIWSALETTIQTSEQEIKYKTETFIYYGTEKCVLYFWAENTKICAVRTIRSCENNDNNLQTYWLYILLWL